MKEALKKVLKNLGSQEQSHLYRMILKAHMANGSYPCSCDCDRKLARINLCPHCQLEEQILAPMLDTVEEIKGEVLDD
jgi:hypothetical protein